MKILVISLLFPNSINPNFGIFVLNRLKHINKQCDLIIINPVPWFPFSFMFKKYKQFSRVPKKEIIENLQVYHPRFFIIPRFFKFIDSITYAMAVIPLALQLKKKFKFDLIDLHWTYPDLPAGRLLSLIASKKQLVTIRGKEALCLDELSIRAKTIKYCLKGSHKIITLSDELKEDVMALGIPGNTVQTIRNGVDTHLFHYIGKKKSRRELHLPLEGFMVLSVGSLIHRKGHDRVLRNFKKLLETQPEATLYIIGSAGPEGDFKKELCQLIRELALEGRVHFKGQVPNATLVFWYNAADMFCLLSRGEGSPNVLSEALACGCPSIATRVGSVPDILDNPSLGTITANDDKKIMSSFLEVAKKDYDREWIAEYMKPYGWDWCAQQMVDVYKGMKTVS